MVLVGTDKKTVPLSTPAIAHWNLTDATLVTVPKIRLSARLYTIMRLNWTLDLLTNPQQLVELDLILIFKSTFAVRMESVDQLSKVRLITTSTRTPVWLTLAALECCLTNAKTEAALCRWMTASPTGMVVAQMRFNARIVNVLRVQKNVTWTILWRVLCNWKSLSTPSKTTHSTLLTKAIKPSADSLSHPTQSTWMFRVLYLIKR